MAYCKLCQCGHLMVYEARGGAPLRCPQCGRFIAFINEEEYREPEKEQEEQAVQRTETSESSNPSETSESSEVTTEHTPEPEPESPKRKSFLITLESPDGELVLPIREKMDVGRNAAGKEYLGRFPDVTRTHITIAPRANSITATLTDHGRWGTYVNGIRMVKESSVVVSNYSEIRLASKAILLVRVKEVEEDD